MSISKKTKRHRRKARQNRKQKRLEIFYNLGASAIFIAGILFLTWLVLPNSRYSKTISQAGEWLLERQKTDGSFVEKYNPWLDTEDPEITPSKQAGAAYIMSQLASYYADGKYLTASVNSLNFLATQNLENNPDILNLATLTCENIRGTALWSDPLIQNCENYGKLLEDKNPLVLAKIYKNNPTPELAIQLQNYSSNDLNLQELNTLDQIFENENYTNWAYTSAQNLITQKNLNNTENSVNNCEDITQLLSGYALAKRHENQDMLDYLKPIIDKNLTKLSKFQIGKNSSGKITRNNYETKVGLVNPKKSVGGFLNSLATDAQILEIGATQKCLEAFLLAEQEL